MKKLNLFFSSIILSSLLLCSCIDGVGSPFGGNLCETVDPWIYKVAVTEEGTIDEDAMGTLNEHDQLMLRAFFRECR